LADVVSWVSKPGRYLFHNTPVIPDNHFTSFLFSILKPQRTIRTFLRLFSITNTVQLPLGGCKQTLVGFPQAAGDLTAEVDHEHRELCRIHLVELKQ